MVLNGKSAAPGAAVGRIYVYKRNLFTPVESSIPAGEEQSHLYQYLSVKKQALQELEKLKTSMQKRDPEKAEIFIAHQEIIDDIVINEEIPAKILNEHWSGDWAIYHVYETVIAVLKKAPDLLIAERAADFDDVRTLLLRLWYGEKGTQLSDFTESVILAANDLMPSDIADMDNGKVLAILTATGGITSHTAIIAKSYGIPAIMGIQGLCETVEHGQLAAVDANEGIVILDPQEDVAAEYREKQEAFHRDRQEAQAFLTKEGRTSDDIRIEIGLNIDSVKDKDLEASAYTDSIGVFRTEFIYMGRDTLPTEDEQFASYRKVLEKYGQKPVYLRTIDIGGDKPAACLNMQKEDNPFLGNRALRYCFNHPEIFKTQLRAALRASVHGNLWLMFPMAGSIDDIRRAKEHLESAKEELKKEGKPFSDFKVGIMIEIPSIALIADIAAAEVDFASIGSNDLCQYLCAADRTNSFVSDYYQSYHPGLFRLIRETVRVFDTAGKSISLCGELAADPLVIPVLIGLGLRKLSMTAASVAAVKRAIASIDIKKCEIIAANVTEFATADEVKEFLISSV